MDNGQDLQGFVVLGLQLFVDLCNVEDQVQVYFEYWAYWYIYYFFGLIVDQMDIVQVVGMCYFIKRYNNYIEYLFILYVYNNVFSLKGMFQFNFCKFGDYYSSVNIINFFDKIIIILSGVYYIYYKFFLCIWNVVGVVVVFNIQMFFLVDNVLIF